MINTTKRFKNKKPILRLMLSSQNLGDLLRHTRTELKYLIYFASRTRKPFTVFSDSAQIPIDAETRILNEVLITVGEQRVNQYSAASYIYYDREISPDHVRDTFAKFQLAMSTYLQSLRRDESSEAAFLAAKKAIGVR